MRGKELPVAFCDCQEQKWLQPRLLVVYGDRGEVLELSTVPEMRGRVQQTRVKRIISLFCLDTTTGDQTALYSDLIVPSAITFLFVAVNVLMLQN